MADIKFEAPTVAYTAYLTTELNALDGDVETTVLGGEINNETNLCMFMDLELTLASLNLSAAVNPTVPIYLIESIDGGTDFDSAASTATASLFPPPDKICCQFNLRLAEGAEAKLAVQTLIPIPPGRFKLMLSNKTGVDFGATLNTLYYRTYNLQSV